MKKILLILASALMISVTLVSAQQKLQLYTGNKTTDFFNFPFYTYQQLKKKLTAWPGTNDSCLLVYGTSHNYYLGGFGNQSYNADNTLKKLSLHYNGDFAMSYVTFDAMSSTDSTYLRIDLEENNGSHPPDNAWGYLYKINEAGGPRKLQALLKDFKRHEKDSQPIGRNMTSADFAKVNTVQFNIIIDKRGGVAYSEVYVDNVVLEDKDNITGLKINSNAASINEEVKAYDLIGNYIGTGTIKEFHLEKDRVYILKEKSGRVRKIVIQ